MNTIYTTESGSIYEVDHANSQVRWIRRSSLSTSERVSDEWRTYAELLGGDVGQSLVIVWGRGRDEHSATAVQFGVEPGVDDGDVTRTTCTSAVTSVSELL